MAAEPTVFVVDDDQAVRKSLRRLMESVGLRVETFCDAASFLEHFDAARPGCLVVDIRMPGLSGLQLQEKLARERAHIPVIVISGHADVEQAVHAMKTGAVDFIRKPYKGGLLVERIHEALELDAQLRAEAAEQAEVGARLAKLTLREREVMGHLVRGLSSKQIALELGLSRKTVDIHRSHLMTKLQIDSVAELVRIAYLSGSNSGTTHTGTAHSQRLKKHRPAPGPRARQP